MVPEFLFSLRGKFWSHGGSSYSKDIIKGVCAVCICTYVYVTYIIYNILCEITKFYETTTRTFPF